jgi:tetratricopeptide (TPR) repeat protein
MKKSAENYLEKGRAERAAGNFEKARKAFTKAIELDPNNAQAYFERGKGRDDINNYFDDALDDFYKALELDPNLTDVYLEIVCFDALQGCQPDESDLEMMTKYVEGRPNDPNAYNERAYGYFATGQYAKAIEDYTKAIELDPEYPPYYFERGILYENIQKFDLAIMDYKTVIRLQGSNRASKNDAIGSGF